VYHCMFYTHFLARDPRCALLMGVPYFQRIHGVVAVCVNKTNKKQNHIFLSTILHSWAHVFQFLATYSIVRLLTA